jgi:triosephosphate isomerase
MRRKLVAGNWKLNGTLAGVERLAEGIRAGAQAVGAADIVVCPAFVHIPKVAGLLAGTSVAWGAQDVSDQDEGAYTGEVGAPMLVELGCRYAIVGHSERRILYGEDDALVARKFLAARRAGLIPILCVGELIEERESGITEQVVGRQLDAVLEAAGETGLAGSVIAYEPVWAIGTGKTGGPEQAQEVHAFIRARIAARDGTIAERIRILHGGSVKGSNAAELFAMEDIDGGLIGGASLKAEEFLTICRAAG